MNGLKDALWQEARDAGFAKMGICRPDAVPETAERLAAFVEAGHHGQMAWMAERMHWRGDASALWPEAQSVVMLAEPYAPDVDPLEALNARERATVSVYAQGRDYHDLVQTPDAQIKVFVDTAPVMEKPLAQAAGLGWQGKHTNLLARDLGSWFFLGAIFTTIDLPKDTPADEHCGNCTACLDICPTDAFPAPFRLDARKCISYLTIEHKGPVDLGLREKMGNRIYGCDDCLAVCPWNKFAQSARDIRYAPRPDLQSPQLADLVTLDDAGFRAKFSGSPIKRIGRNRFVRNVLYEIGNSGEAALADAARRLLDDPDVGVSDAAQWAVERLQ